MAFIPSTPHSPPPRVDPRDQPTQVRACGRLAERMNSRGFFHSTQPRIKTVHRFKTALRPDGGVLPATSTRAGSSSASLGTVFLGLQAAAEIALLSLAVSSRGGHDIQFKVKIKVLKSLMKPHGALLYPGASRKHAGLLAGPSSRRRALARFGTAKPKAGNPQAGSTAVTRAHISPHAPPLCLNFFNVDGDLFLSNYQPVDEIKKELPKAVSGGSAVPTRP